MSRGRQNLNTQPANLLNFAYYMSRKKKVYVVLPQSFEQTIIQETIAELQTQQKLQFCSSSVPSNKTILPDIQIRQDSIWDMQLKGLLESNVPNPTPYKSKSPGHQHNFDPGDLRI